MDGKSKEVQPDDDGRGGEKTGAGMEKAALSSSLAGDGCDKMDLLLSVPLGNVDSFSMDMDCPESKSLRYLGRRRRID